MPQSAFLRAGASFTPSPVMPTIWPCFCRTSMMSYLCSGNTCANPSALSMSAAVAGDCTSLASPKVPASRILVPMASCLEVSLAMAIASPVTILILTPMASALAMVDLASGRGGSNSGSTPTSRHGPSPSARATPSDRNPRAAKSSTALSTADFTSEAFAASARTTCGAPLVTLKALPSMSLTCASVRLWTGSKGVKWSI